MKGCHIDVGTEKVTDEYLPDDVVNSWMGGKGLGIYVLLEHNPKDVDPFAPENNLIVAAGPFSATTIPGSFKSCVVSKSPLTGMAFDSIASSGIAGALVTLGYQYVRITGRAESPVVIFMDKDGVEFRPAAHYWGTLTSDVLNSLAKDGGEIICIGPAGERNIAFANIASRLGFFGRGGSGAVMGAKNVKALQVNPDEGYTPDIADADMFHTYYLKAVESIKKSTYFENLPQHGTLYSFDILYETNSLTTNYFQNTPFDAAPLLADEFAKHFVAHFSCTHCIIDGLKRSSWGNEKETTQETAGPKFQTVWAFGPNCGTNDVTSILEASNLCDEYGIDTISCGNMIAFLMKCAEHGIINENISFGAPEDVLKMIHAIVARKGTGDSASNGVEYLSETLGKDAAYYAMHIKGLELPAYDAAKYKGYCLGISVSSRGGCHRKAPMSVEKYGYVDPALVKGKGKLLVKTENFATICDSLILCGFVSVGSENITGLLHSLGYTFIAEHTDQIAARIVLAYRLYNMRERTGYHDYPPPRIFDQGHISKEDFELMRDEYYKERGITAGKIDTDTIIHLGLEKYGGRT